MPLFDVAINRKCKEKEKVVKVAALTPMILDSLRLSI
jgi:hypothetical protein